MGSSSRIATARSTASCAPTSDTRMKLVLLTLVAVMVTEGRMVSRDNRVARVARQAEDDEKTQPGPFDLFGQVLGSFAGLVGTIGKVGGEFLDDQNKLNQPVLETVGDISGTIHRSGFVRSAASTVEQGPDLLGRLLNILNGNNTL